MNEPLALPQPIDAETWRPLPLCIYYDVSSLGRIRSWRSRREGDRRVHPRLLKPTIDKDGYGTVQLTLNDRSTRRIKTSRLVALAFIGERPGMVVRHLSGDTSNNTINNLAYGSHRDNTNDAIRHGTFANCIRDFGNRVRGEKNNNAKLTAEGARAVVDRISRGEKPKALASEFGVTIGQIYHIRDGRAWAWATGVVRAASVA